MSVFVCEKCGHAREDNDDSNDNKEKEVKGKCINGCREFKEV
jgi:hypothetical protein